MKGRNFGCLKKNLNFKKGKRGLMVLRWCIVFFFDVECLIGCKIDVIEMDGDVDVNYWNGWLVCGIIMVLWIYLLIVKKFFIMVYSIILILKIKIICLYKMLII